VDPGSDTLKRADELMDSGEFRKVAATIAGKSGEADYLITQLERVSGHPEFYEAAVGDIVDFLCDHVTSRSSLARLGFDMGFDRITEKCIHALVLEVGRNYYVKEWILKPLAKHKNPELCEAATIIGKSKPCERDILSAGWKRITPLPDPHDVIVCSGRRFAEISGRYGDSDYTTDISETDQILRIRRNNLTCYYVHEHEGV